MYIAKKKQEASITIKTATQLYYAYLLEQYTKEAGRMSITTHPANAPVTPTSESTETLECCQKHFAQVSGTFPVCNQCTEHLCMIIEMINNYAFWHDI